MIINYSGEIFKITAILTILVLTDRSNDDIRQIVGEINRIFSTPQKNQIFFIVAVDNIFHTATVEEGGTGGEDMNEMIHLGQAITVVITTVATDEDARKLSRELVEQQLAACVQLTPIVSVYSWKGEIEEDREIRLMIKVVEERKIDVVRYLKKNHPYDTPEIILTAFSSDRDYYEWCMSVSGIQKK